MKKVLFFWSLLLFTLVSVASQSRHTTIGMGDGTSYSCIFSCERAFAERVIRDEESDTTETNCDPVPASGFSEDFSGYTAANYTYTSDGILPPCWDVIGTTNEYRPHIFRGFTEPYNNCLVMSSGSNYHGGPTNIVVMPLLDDLSGKQVSFATSMNSMDRGGLTVGYVTDLNAGSFVALEEIPYNSCNEVVPYVYHEVDVSGVPTGARIAFKWDKLNNVSCLCTLDDIVIEDLSTCQKPSDVTVSDVTIHSASISWTDNNETPPPFWTLSLNGMDTIVEATSITFNNLAAGTIYGAKVKANCTEEESHWSTEVYFITDCDIQVAEGYTEDFSGYVYTNSSAECVSFSRFLPCWDNIYTGTVDCRPHVDKDENDDIYLLLISGEVAEFGAVSYAIMPEFDNVDSMELSFYYRMWNVSRGRLTVGYISDIHDAATFVALGAVPSSTSDRIYRDTLMNVPAGVRLAFKWDCTGCTWDYGCCIDDIHLTFAACDAPTDVSVNRDVLTWNGTAANYEIMIMVGQDTVVDTIVNANSYVITGLNDDDYATVRVRSICFDGYISEWSEAVAFYAAPCAPAPWCVDNNGIVNVTFGQTEIVNNNTHPSSEPFYGEYTSQVGNGAAGTYVPMSITYATGYTYGTIVWVNWNQDLEFTDDEVVYTGTSTNDNPTTLSCTFFIPPGTPVGNYRMRIGGSDSGFDNVISNGYGYNPCLTAAFTIYEDYTLSVTEMPSCLLPIDVTVSDVTGNSATFSWTDNNETAPESWTVNINGVDTNVTDNPVTFYNLTDNTTYTVRVRANCSATDYSDWSLPTTFTIPCYPISAENYSEDFNSYYATTDELAVGVLPDCWQYICSSSYDVAKPHIYSGHSSVTDSDNSLLLIAGHDMDFYYFYGEANYALMPVFEDLTGKQVTFRMKMSSTAGILTVGYVTDAGSALSFTALRTFSSVTVADTFSVVVNSVLADARIAFCWSSNAPYSGCYYCSIDDVVIEDMPSCVTPFDITVTNITATSAVIGWTDVNLTTPEMGWTVRLNGIDTLVSEVPFVVNNLIAASYNTVSVRSNCDADNASGWSPEVHFYTACGVVVVSDTHPFEEDFNDITAGIPYCWDNPEITGTTGGNPWGYSASGVTGGCARFNSGNNVVGYYNVLETPVLDIAELDRPTLSFQYKNPTGGDFDVLVSTDGGGTYTTLATGLTGVMNWTRMTIQLDNLESYDQVVIGFWGIGNFGMFDPFGDNDPYIDLDNVLVAECPSCMYPSDIEISNVTTNAATIDWTDHNAGVPQSWTISLNGADTVVTMHPFTIDNLVAGTIYTAMVRANCFDDDESVWSDGVSFHTACDLIVVTADNPYQDGFENQGICWDIEPIVGGEEFQWRIGENAIYAHDGDYFAVGSYEPGAESRLVSPVFDVTQIEPVLMFQHKQALFDLVAADEMGVYYRTAPMEEWIQLASYTTEFDEYTQETISLPNPSATYQISFVSVGHDGYYVFLDDISISDICSVPANAAIRAKVFPNPTTGRVTVESNAVNADITVYDMFGRIVMASKVVSERTVLDFKGYAQGLYIIRISDHQSCVNIKVVKE